jgi:hypothetical protein
MATQTSSDFNTYSPRAVQVGTNRMHAAIVTPTSAGVSISASDELWMVPIPPSCFVVGGSIKASQPAGTTGQTVIKLGTKESDNCFGTYTVSGTVQLAAKLSIFSPVTVSTSDDVSPHQRAVLATINASPTTQTTSLSLYVQIEYVMPGIIN